VALDFHQYSSEVVGPLLFPLLVALDFHWYSSGVGALLFPWAVVLDFHQSSSEVVVEDPVVLEPWLLDSVEVFEHHHQLVFDRHLRFFFLFLCPAVLVKFEWVMELLCAWLDF
jgi:hypothetical protein